MGLGVSKQKHLVVLVDMDDVLNNFEEHFLEKYKEKFPEEPCIPCEERRSINLLKDYQSLPGVNPSKIKENVTSIYRNEEFNRTIPAKPGAIEAVKEMANMEDVDVFIVSVPLYEVSEYKFSVREKYDWIQSNLGTEWMDKLIITWDKTLIQGDILFDDRANIKGTIDPPAWEHIVFSSCNNMQTDIGEKRRLHNWTDGSWRHILNQKRQES